MIVVSDSSPLITFLKIDALDLLGKIYGEVKIPNAVFSEITCNPRFEKEAEKLKNCGFVEVCAVSDKAKVDFIQKTAGLDLGESEALALCDDLNSDLLLMDEMRGRFVAKQLGLSVAGGVGGLAFAYKAKLVSADKMREYVAILRKSKRNIGDKLLDGLLQMLA